MVNNVLKPMQSYKNQKHNISFYRAISDLLYTKYMYMYLKNK